MEIEWNINILILVRTEEKYVFLYDDEEKSYQECLRILGRFASNLELSFTWYDAAVLSHKMRQQREKQQKTFLLQERFPQ